MDEMTKEHRVVLITSWKGIVEDQNYDLSAIQLEVETLASRLSVLAAKKKLLETRLGLAQSALSILGVRL